MEVPLFFDGLDIKVSDELTSVNICIEVLIL
jgi:hypothetical protein